MYLLKVTEFASWDKENSKVTGSSKWSSILTAMKWSMIEWNVCTIRSDLPDVQSFFQFSENWSEEVWQKTWKGWKVWIKAYINCLVGFKKLVIDNSQTIRPNTQNYLFDVNYSFLCEKWWLVRIEPLLNVHWVIISHPKLLFYGRKSYFFV